MESISDFCLVYVIVKNKNEANKLASISIKKKLAVCGNIFPKTHSIFKWNNKIQEAKETLLILKTNNKNYKKLEKNLKENHSYEIPCILKIPLSGGNVVFFNWMSENLN